MVGAIASMWSDRRIMWSVATALPAVAALLVAMAMPREPITTGQALAAMAGGALVGAVAGLATRSRWAMLVCPAVYAGTFELVRVGADGPSMDGIHVDTPVGLFAFATGRVFHGVTALLAPSKQLSVFELSGHRPLFEEPDRFHRVMTDIVLRESESGR
jgi:pimeloyl-ACP methyl ester carboxylesterase